MKKGEKLEVMQKLVGDIRPYQNNPRHNDEAVDAVANSISEFGFQQPIVVDKDGVIIAGHTRYKAAIQLGMKTVPVVVADLTEDQANAYRLADNRTGELATWDFDALSIELEEIEMDMDGFGFDLDTSNVGGADWFDREDHHDTSREEDNDEYNDFLDKFEIKKTTDDCYTPVLVYEAVADWVAKEYNVDRANFVRPFYPGGDYQKERYKIDDIVVDNPPFSILAEILRWYTEHGVKFFLFAPTLTLFSSLSATCATALPVGVGVTYENGAIVSTSFLTNMDENGLRVKSAPSLYKAVYEADCEWRKERRKELPKYSYPNEVITSAMIARYSKNGVDFSVPISETYPCSALDAQKEYGKTIYGKGYLISEKAAAEKATAEKAADIKYAVWELSEREREIVKSLGKE